MDSGDLLRMTRRQCGLTQAALARRAATTQNYVSRIERGSVVPSLVTLERLFHAMGMQLRVEAVPLSTGNADPAELRADYQTSTPEQRVADAMALSEFLTELAGAARSERAPR